MVIVLMPLFAHAQKTVRHSNQQWVQYYNQLKLNSHWTLMTDGGFRWADKFSTKALFIARIGIGYNINSHLRVGAGLASTGAYSSSSLSKLEYRPYQELFASYKYGRVGLQHRFRVEERYFKSVVDGDPQSGHNFNFRLRYQISANIPLLKLSPDNPDKILSLGIGDEIFINAGREIVNNILDKNRIIIGPAVQFNKQLTVALSYTHQYSQLATAGAYAHDDVMWLAIRHNLDLSKHKPE
ncbi:MAG: DUF2490 domain-containing protein [Cyclobacteriaceae bacterium]|nr:DUF2490 domain-containing protein [Cyclobacteriaceae bacterium]